MHYRNQQNEKKYEQAVEKGYSGEEFLNKIVPEDVFYKYDYLFGNDSGKIADAVSDDNWGEPNSMEHDFSTEEMLDMPIMCKEISKQNNIADNEFHDNSNHGIFCVTERDLDLIDIDDLV